MGVIVKGSIVNTEEYKNPADNVVLRSDEVIIKRYRLNYTIPQQVRLGMLPYSALEEYERQKALEAEQQSAEEQVSADIPADAEEAPKRGVLFGKRMTETVRIYLTQTMKNSLQKTQSHLIILWT